MNKLENQDFKKWISELKQQVYSTQMKASRAVNSALVEFYYFLGKSISEKENVWGTKLLEQTSRELISEFPTMKGFSVRNLKYCRNFYNFYSAPIGQQAVAQLENNDFVKNNMQDEFGQQAVAQLQSLENKGYNEKSQISQQAVAQFVPHLVKQIPWGHNILIFTKSKDIEEAIFYN